MWRDARLSGSVFGGLTVGYLVLEWSSLSVFCLTAYAMLTIIGGLLVWHYAAPFVKMSFPRSNQIFNNPYRVYALQEPSYPIVHSRWPLRGGGEETSREAFA